MRYQGRREKGRILHPQGIYTSWPQWCTFLTEYCGSAFSMTHPSPQLSSPLQGKAPGIYKACTVAGCERGHEIELPRTRPAFTGRGCRWNTGHSVKFEFQIHLTEPPGASVLVLPNLAALLATTSGWPPRTVESAFQILPFLWIFPFHQTHNCASLQHYS